MGLDHLSVNLKKISPMCYTYKNNMEQRDIILFIHTVLYIFTAVKNVFVPFCTEWNNHRQAIIIYNHLVEKIMYKTCVNEFTD